MYTVSLALYHLAATSDQSNIVNRERSEHSELQGWSYAVLVRFMGGSYHHIGGSVGSHLPEIQQHAQSWRSGHVCGRPRPAGTGEQAYHEQVWSVTLALATIKGMVGRPNNRAIQTCEGLDQSLGPHPHVIQQHPQVGGSGGLRTQRIRLWVVGCERSVLRPYPCFPCCSMLHESSMGGGVLHGIA